MAIEVGKFLSGRELLPEPANDAPFQMRDLERLAREWADTITSVDAPWHIKCEVMAWGFREVQTTARNPSNVLREVVDRIRARSRKEVEEPPA